MYEFSPIAFSRLATTVQSRITTTRAPQQLEPISFCIFHSTRDSLHQDQPGSESPKKECIFSLPAEDSQPKRLPTTDSQYPDMFFFFQPSYFSTPSTLAAQQSELKGIKVPSTSSIRCLGN